MFWYHDHMNVWGYGLMAFSSLLFWALVVAGIVLLVRYLGRTTGQPLGGDRRQAERILAERFARGEIDEDEYRQRLETLRTTTDPAARR